MKETNNISVEKEFAGYVSQNILGMLGISAYVLADTFLFPERKVLGESQHLIWNNDSIDSCNNGCYDNKYFYRVNCTGYLSATENADWAFFISIVRGVVAIIVCALILAYIFGMTGVWLAFPVAEFITTFFLIAAMKKISYRQMELNDF